MSLSFDKYIYENKVEPPCPCSLDGVWSYFSTCFLQFSPWERVDSIYREIVSGTCNPDIFRCLNQETMHSIGLRLIWQKDQGSLPFLKYVYGRLIDQDCRREIARIGECLENIYCIRRPLEIRAFIIEQKMRPLCEVAEQVLDRWQESGQGEWQDLYCKIHRLGSDQRKKIFERAQQLPESLRNLAEKVLRMENVRRAMLYSISERKRKSDREKTVDPYISALILGVAQYAHYSLAAYTTSFDEIIDVFEELSAKRLKGFVSFFLRWVEIHKRVPEYAAVRSRVEEIARKRGCFDTLQEICQEKEKPRPTLSKHVGGTFFDLRNAIVAGGRKERKELAKLVAQDLFELSGQVFVQAYPVDLCLRRNFFDIIAFSDRVRDLVLYLILYFQDDLKTAQRMAKFWLRVALHARDQGDAATCATLIGVLNNPAVYRLAYEKERCLIKHYHEGFTELSDLFSPVSAHNAYRNFITKRMIPYTAIPSKDMLFIRDTRANYGEGGLPPILYLAGKTIRELIYQQKRVQGSLGRAPMTNIPFLVSGGSELLRQKTERDHDERSRILRPKKQAPQ